MTARTLLVSDIFGLTGALEACAHSLDATIVDPYDGAKKDFAHENEAYAYFMQNVGIEHYSHVIRDCLSKETTPVNLVGFSVGGSAIWNLSQILSPSNIDTAMCVYSSQIRKALHIRPKIPVHLILPASEAHFSVQDLAHAVSQIPNVTTEQCQYLHGFMNPHSENFDKTGYEYYIKKIKERLI